MTHSFANNIDKLWEKIQKIFNNPKETDKQELMDRLEDTLLESDIGVLAAHQIVENISRKTSSGGIDGAKSGKRVLYDELLTILSPFEKPLKVSPKVPTVLLLIGVNGSGKTTVAGKLANLFKEKQYSVLLGAADTFRAAGVEQIRNWGERISVPVVNSKDEDPASVTYKTIKRAVIEGINVTIIDTAGRLPTQLNLMNELEKIKKVARKNHQTANLITLLTIDANTGQNNINQVNMFNEKIGVDGLILTKLDGTSKGGAIVAIAKENGLPINFIGTGEKVDDLKLFDADQFVVDLLK